MAVLGRFGSLLIAALIATGCSNEVSGTSTASLDGTTIPDERGAGAANGGATSDTAEASACENPASWNARSDFAFDASTTPRKFAEAVNALVRDMKTSAMAVNNHVDAKCVWMVSFSASDETKGAGSAHATSFTTMFRHPAGLWTAAPQESGWFRVVDAAGKTVWIPLASVTGSATYGGATCAKLTSVEATAFIPRSAGSIVLSTAKGKTTLEALLGEGTRTGWKVQFGFSADVAR